MAPTDVRHWPGMRSEHTVIPPGHSAGRTEPNQVGVSFTRHRAAVYESGGKTVEADIAAGAAFVTGQEPITWTRVRETSEALEIFPDLALFDLRDLEPRAATVDGTVLAISSILRRVHATGSTLSDIAASTLAHRLAAHLLEHYGFRRISRREKGILDRGTVDRVAEFVDAELGGVLTLDRLAGVAMLSPFHFARAFKATTGLAPHQFVTARRVDRAKAQLLHTSASVTDIAHAVGLSNVSHFRRVFRGHTGVLPGALRSRGRGGGTVGG
ncbi:MAG TPA: AraC family transcriptional regulator [Actinophytocola sp.]|uniref:helix-turn-helix transcriptional regulator n=1 Tax=Actinophytocola sp. TaxID=1872138 RepID=UPI002DDDB559|nr:AraC family transcriptional regulator [Actinophytocola sp.]HEV2779898.1 AraC family transcriptional regulator [Actinophytocola sp.]